MRRTLVRVLVVLVVLACGFGILLIGTLFFGHVSGEEFAPDTFERRFYSYFELPVVRIQVTPVQRIVDRPRIAKTLADNNYIANTGPPKRWDFVISRRVGETWREGDALILTRYLDTWGDRSETYWLQWTQDHPATAKILWPTIAKLALQELYLFTPDVFSLAAEQTDPQAFESDLKRVLARKYEELAQVEVELANFPAALRFFTEALGYEPNREASLRGLAQAREALGRSTPEQP